MEHVMSLINRDEAAGRETQRAEGESRERGSPPGADALGRLSEQLEAQGHGAAAAHRGCDQL
jgi:hypothetical protein